MTSLTNKLQDEEKEGDIEDKKKDLSGKSIKCRLRSLDPNSIKQLDKIKKGKLNFFLRMLEN